MSPENPRNPKEEKLPELIPMEEDNVSLFLNPKKFYPYKNVRNII